MKYDENNIFAKILRGEIPCNIPLLRMGRVYVPRETLIEWKEGGSHSSPPKPQIRNCLGFFYTC